MMILAPLARALLRAILTVREKGSISGCRKRTHEPAAEGLE